MKTPAAIRLLITSDDIQKALPSLPGWTLEKGRLVFTAKLKDFSQSLQFVNAVGYLAEKANHHPDFTIKYNQVGLTLTTHDSGGITQKDINLAKAISELLK